MRYPSGVAIEALHSPGMICRIVRTIAAESRDAG